MALAATGGLFYWHGKKKEAGTQRVEAVPTLLQPGWPHAPLPSSLAPSSVTMFIKSRLFAGGRMAFARVDHGVGANGGIVGVADVAKNAAP